MKSYIKFWVILITLSFTNAAKAQASYQLQQAQGDQIRDLLAAKKDLKEPQALQTVNHARDMSVQACSMFGVDSPECSENARFYREVAFILYSSAQNDKINVDKQLRTNVPTGKEDSDGDPVKEDYLNIGKMTPTKHGVPAEGVAPENSSNTITCPSGMVIASYTYSPRYGTSLSGAIDSTSLTVALKVPDKMADTHGTYFEVLCLKKQYPYRGTGTMNTPVPASEDND